MPDRGGEEGGTEALPGGEGGGAHSWGRGEVGGMGVAGHRALVRQESSQPFPQHLGDAEGSTGPCQRVCSGC